MIDVPKIGLTQDHVLKRALSLYGLHAILFHVFFVFAYYALPDGFMRSGPQMASAEAVARQPSFWSQFGMTLFFNMGVVILIIVLCNFNRIKGIPVGYLVPVSLAITGGLVVGTNSFLADCLHAIRLSGRPPAMPCFAKADRVEDSAGDGDRPDDERAPAGVHVHSTVVIRAETELSYRGDDVRR